MAGIFGGIPGKKKSLFNQMPGMNPSTDPMTQGGFGAPGQMTQQMPQTPAKTGTNWAGILADFLSGASGGTPMFAQQQYANRQDDRQQQQRQQQQEQQRQSQRSDWLWQQQWKKDNEPNEPKDQLTRYMLAAGIDPASEEGKTMYSNAAMNSANPIQGVPYTDEQGNSGLQFIRPGAQGAQIVPKVPVGKLRPIGGQTVSPSATFRP